MQIFTLLNIKTNEYQQMLKISFELLHIFKI